MKLTKPIYRFGLTIGHDASVAIADSKGVILFAASEERYSRLKGHLGSPLLAFKKGVESLGISKSDLSQSLLTVGGDFGEIEDWFLSMLLSPSHQKNYDIFNLSTPPGLVKLLKSECAVNPLPSRFAVATAFGFEPDNVYFVNHHDAHASSAFWPSNFTNATVLTLDGSGDNESGTITLMDNLGTKKVVYRIPDNLSLGHLYSEVTKRYGFKESKHEGKITGLAAFSTLNTDVSQFKELLCCKNGKLKFRMKYLLDPRNYDRLDLWSKPNHRKAFTLAVGRIESRMLAFPDLAKEIQIFTEDTVIQLLEQNLPPKQLKQVAAAGGVFSNVSLNKRIRDYFGFEEFYVFPNMGDGGLSVGAIWEQMRISNDKISGKVISDMYIGDELLPDTNLNIRRVDINASELAKLIIEGKIIGTLFGRMEFGPRALCHRSIIASPVNKEINKELNYRLNRTDFMPFAPVIRDVDFNKVFDIQKSPTNFKFMTETVVVKDYWRNKIPAVVHLDHTARPQILSVQDNPLLYETLTLLSEKHELPVVINTSFNAHEEPIISTEEQGLGELKKGRIDFLISNRSNLLISK